MEVMEDGGARLRAVFELCDSEKKGYISVDHFVNLAREHFGAGEGDQDTEDIRRIVQVLDPEGDGKIHFGEFCQGVQQILELKSPSTPLVSVPSPTPPLPATRPQVLGGDSLCHQDEDANSSGTHETSELSTFNEYDMMTDDDVTPVAGHSDSALFSDSAHFLLGVSSCSAVGSEDDHDSGMSAKSSESHDTGLPSHRPEIEGTDDYRRYHDGGIDEAVSDPETSSQPKHKPEYRTHRRVTSNGLASQLFRINTERKNSYGSDEIFDDIDGNFVELNDKVKKLEAQIQFLTDNQQKTDIRHVRLKEENCSLVERVHLLEEQLRDVESKSKEIIADEQRRNRDALERLDKDKAMEIDILSQSLKHIEGEYQSLKEEAPRLRTENDRLRKENVQLEKQLHSAHQQLLQLSEEHEDLQQRHHTDVSDMEQERKVSSQLIDELSRELDEMRTVMESTNTVSPHKGSHDLSRSQRKELEAKIIRLKEENVHLLEEKEELLLGNHIREGRSLVNGGMSLAEEIENLPKDELLKTVRELQQENGTLREYIDRITLRIIEKNPALLEIPVGMSSRKK